MRKKIIAGNWKMNLLQHEANELVRSLSSQEVSKDIIRIVFPPFIYISELINATD